MPKSYRLVQTQQFKYDFKEAIRFLSVTLGNAPAADALIDEFERVSDLVSSFPLSMPQYEDTLSNSDEIYRVADVKKYLAFYVVKDDTVEFRRFLYARSNIPVWLA